MISDKLTQNRNQLWIASTYVLLLVVWALAGFLMEGEDGLEDAVPLMVILGGGAGERHQLACELFAQGHGHDGVVLTGDNMESLLSERIAYLTRCGIPEYHLIKWTHTANTFEEISSLGRFLAINSNVRMIVISDTLHMPRLRYLRDKLDLNGKILFRQSRLDLQLIPDTLLRVIVFWFREPLAYLYYRLKY